MELMYVRVLGVLDHTAGMPGAWSLDRRLTDQPRLTLVEHSSIQASVVGASL